MHRWNVGEKWGIMNDDKSLFWVSLGFYDTVSMPTLTLPLTQLLYNKKTYILILKGCRLTKIFVCNVVC